MEGKSTMRKIKSFSINHDLLPIGLYLSRQDGDISTYDLRFKRPNAGDYLENAALHTLEHLIATYVRNSALASHVVYFGPMGCRTGFYLLLRDLPPEQAVNLVKEALLFVCRFEGDIPGAERRECGNYLEHDLEGAKTQARAYYDSIRLCTADSLAYPATDG